MTEKKCSTCGKHNTECGADDNCAGFAGWVPKEVKETGIKYDNGKPRIGEMIMDFAKPLLQVCKVWEFGAHKYKKSNWKKVENGWDRYTNAMTRHQLLEETEYYDDETGIPHAVHTAWNALARLFFLPVEIEEKE